MHAIELPVEIDKNHQIHLQLPDSVTATKARVIVIYEDTAQLPKPTALDEFLSELPITPANKGLSREEIQQYIQQERQGWDK